MGMSEACSRVPRRRAKRASPSGVFSRVAGNYLSRSRCPYATGPDGPRPARVFRSAPPVSAGDRRPEPVRRSRGLPCRRRRPAFARACATPIGGQMPRRYTDSNLFHQGAAKESTDPDVIAATMKEPGVVLNVLRAGVKLSRPPPLGKWARPLDRLTRRP
jgi:hypothetical protein